MHRRHTLLALLALPASLLAEGAGDSGPKPRRQVLQVGPDRPLPRPSAAARIAPPGALIEIDAADYHGDVAVWTQHGITLRGVGGRARLHAQGRSAEGKAVWVIRGNLVTVENLELSGCRVPDHNGAGIRAEGVGLTLRNCRLHHNEMGILTSHQPRSTLLIEDCEIDHNTTDTARHGKLGHNLYVGRIGRFMLLGSHVHDAREGHLVKTRARRNEIIGNRLLDGDGASSYLVDLSEGGAAVVRGNELEQGPASANRTAISFAPEAADKHHGHSLRVESNHFVNRGPAGTFVRNHSDAAAVVRGNRIEGRVRPLAGPGEVS